MDSYYLSSFLFLLSLLLLLKLLKSSASKSKYLLPPGPWRLPVIGSLHHLVGRGLPHHALRTLSEKYGQLMSLQLGEIQAVVVSSKDAAREVLKAQDLSFCSRPISPTIKVLSYNGSDIAMAPYGEYWRHVRKICVLELLSTKRVNSFRSIREEEVNGLTRQIQSLSYTGQVVNLTEKLFIVTNDVTLRATLGRKTKYQDLYLDEVQNYTELGAQVGIANMFPSSRLARIITGTVRKAEESLSRMDRIFENILKAQRENKADGEAENLLQVLLRLHDQESNDNVLSMNSIKAIMLDTFTGGTETSATTLDWAMVELIRNPRVLKKAQNELRQHCQGYDNITESDIRELHYLHLIIKETLRLHPVLPLLLPRECRETCKVQGYDIPKGTLVLVNAWALGRDTGCWKDAEEFRPERFAEHDPEMNYSGDNFEYIPFGSGRRICPGMMFGLVTVELVLANLLYHFDWELPHGITPDQLDMTESFGVTARRNDPLFLRATPYSIAS